MLLGIPFLMNSNSKSKDTSMKILVFVCILIASHGIVHAGGAALQIVRPSGGELFAEGDTITIGWSGVQAQDTVILEFALRKSRFIMLSSPNSFTRAFRAATSSSWFFDIIIFIVEYFLYKAGREDFNSSIEYFPIPLCHAIV